MAGSIAAVVSWFSANAGTIAAVSSVAGAAATAYGASQAGKGGVDPKALQAQADAEATQSANGRLALRRGALAKNSLLTGGSAQQGSGVLGGGRPTLGG